MKRLVINCVAIVYLANLGYADSSNGKKPKLMQEYESYKAQHYDEFYGTEKPVKKEEAPVLKTVVVEKPAPTPKTVVVEKPIVIQQPEIIIVEKPVPAPAKKIIKNDAVRYDVATIDCEADGVKGVVNDYVQADNFGFDYTKFIPVLTQKNNVSCYVKGKLEIPDDYKEDTINLEINDAKINFGNGYSRIVFINDSWYKEYDGKTARQLHLPVKTANGIKYIEYSIFPVVNHCCSDRMDDRKTSGNQISNFFKLADKLPEMRYIKFSTKRGKSNEVIQIDTNKVFLFSNE